MEPGYIIFVDYGDIADHLYSYERRNGTLRSYYRQQQIHDPFYAIGEQDLTADVDFTAVRLEAEGAGFEGGGFISQGRWLENLGVRNYRSTGVPLKVAEEEIDLLTKNSKLGSAFDVLLFKTEGLPDGPGLSRLKE